MKKTVFAVIAIAAILAAAFLMGTGFQKRTDVLLTGYSVAEDGTAIRLDVQVVSSMGYVRGFQDDGGGVRPHYLNFYRTFGGLNSAWGAEDSFLLPIAPEDTEIYFNRPGGGYELVLQKDSATGQWIRPAA